VSRIRAMCIVVGGKGRFDCSRVVHLFTLAPSAGQVNVRTQVLGSKWLAEAGSSRSVARETPSGESEMRFWPETGLRRVGNAFPARGWPRVSLDCVSCPGLASDES
jgi:hypothetical protein